MFLIFSGIGCLARVLGLFPLVGSRLVVGLLVASLLTYWSIDLLVY